MFQKDNGIKIKPITTKNPQSNANIEGIRQNIGNIIHTFDLSNIVNNDPWSGNLAAIMFAIYEHYHTTLQASAMQLVFVQYTILNIKQVSDWEQIRQLKQKWINRNNKRENMHRNTHNQKFGEKFQSSVRKTERTN